MLNLSDLYSYKGQIPQPLPHRIRLSNNTSKTDNTTFTEDDIIDAGFTGPYSEPVYNEEIEYIEWNSDSLTWEVKNIPLRPQMTEEQLWIELRLSRTEKLMHSDWSVLPDSPLSSDEKEKWKIYRQQLRDLPSTISDINDFNFFEDFPSLT